MIQRQGNLFSAGVSTDGVNYTLIPGTHRGRGPAGHHACRASRWPPARRRPPSTATFSNLSDRRAGHHHDDAARAGRPLPVQLDLRRPRQPEPAGRHHGSGPGRSPWTAPAPAFGGSSDSAHYVYQSVSGNESISAQVVTQPRAQPAKTQDGLMMRASTAPPRPCTASTSIPGGSATVKWRVNDGIATTNGPARPRSPRPPTWRSSAGRTATPARRGPIFSTLTSTDGVTWTPVLGSIAC